MSTKLGDITIDTVLVGITITIAIAFVIMAIIYDTRGDVIKTGFCGIFAILSGIVGLLITRDD